MPELYGSLKPVAGCCVAVVESKAAVLSPRNTNLSQGAFSYERLLDLPAFFGPVITGEQRQVKFVVRLRVLPGQREPALPASALRHPSQP